MLSILATLIIGVGASPDAVLIAGRDTGYFALPPQVVCDATVQNGQWSTNGRYLVLQRERFTFDRASVSRMFHQLVTQPRSIPSPPPDPIEPSLVVWDMASKTSQVIWKARNVNEKIDSWIVAGDSVYLALIQTTPTGNPDEPPILHRSIQIRSIASGNVLYTLHLDSPIEVHLTAYDPKSNRVLVNVGGVNMRNAQLLNPQGARKVEGIPDFVRLDGYAANDGFIVRLESGKVFKIDALTGNATSMDIREYVEPKLAEEKVLLRTDLISVRSANATKSARVLRVVDPKSVTGESEIVAVNVGPVYAVSPGQTAVFYTVDGVALIRELAPVDYKAIKEARDAARRELLLNEGKQLALAIAMFAKDNDNMIPSGLSNDQLLPYVKSDELLNGFTYTFGGGNLSQIKDPQSTEFGYIVGPGGRVVVYADGHVIWKPG